MRSRSESVEKIENLDILFIFVTILLGFLIIYTVIHYAGPSWDIMVRYLEGQTLVNVLGTGVNAQSAFVGEFLNNTLYYFEPYREPLGIPIFAFLSLFLQKPIFEYLILISIGYLFAVYEFGKKLGAESLLAISVFFNAYFVYFFIPNGGEGLSLIFVLLGLVFLLRKKPISGLFLGLASIAKYPTFVFFPLVLLIDDRKKMMKAIALELLPVLLWCLFGYLMYGNPFYSFEASIANSNITTAPTQISLTGILIVIAYPTLLIAIGAIYLTIKNKKIKIKLDYQNKIFAALITLAGLGYLVMLPHNDPFTQMRYGYLFSFALLIPAILILNDAIKLNPLLKYLVALLGLAIMAGALLYIYTVSNTPAVAYYNPNNSTGIYYDANSALGSLGFANCRFISNAWVPMLYSGYDAYSPFIVYPSPTITPIVGKLLAAKGIAYSTYVQQEEQYPIIVFKYLGVPESTIVNLNQSMLAYAGRNFSIYLPMNASCYTN